MHSLKFISSPRIELARHEVTQGKYSPKITEKYRKIPKHHKHVHAANPYNIYIYYIILEREWERRERERRELVRERRRLRERERS